MVCLPLLKELENAFYTKRYAKFPTILNDLVGLEMSAREIQV